MRCHPPTMSLLRHPPWFPTGCASDLPRLRHCCPLLPPLLGMRPVGGGGGQVALQTPAALSAQGLQEQAAALATQLRRETAQGGGGSGLEGRKWQDMCVPAQQPGPKVQRIIL